MIFQRTIFFLFLVVAATNIIAQPVTVIKASVDKSSILIGEPLQLTIEVQITANEPIRFVSIDTIEHFEFLEKPRIDTADTDNGTTLKGIYKITSFDSGRWVIPSFNISGATKTDTIPVDVIFSDFNPAQEYHDIKDIIEVTPEQKKEWWWYAAGGGVLILLLILYLLRKRKPKPVVAAPAVIINPYEEAINNLRELNGDYADIKKYHSRLADIFRLYIFRKKGILSLQKTTDDLVLQVKNLGISKVQYDQLAQSLRLGDFVKFAKYVPAEEDNRLAFETVKKSIDEIERLS